MICMSGKEIFCGNFLNGEIRRRLMNRLDTAMILGKQNEQKTIS